MSSDAKKEKNGSSFIVFALVLLAMLVGLFLGACVRVGGSAGDGETISRRRIAFIAVQDLARRGRQLFDRARHAAIRAARALNERIRALRLRERLRPWFNRALQAMIHSARVLAEQARRVLALIRDALRRKAGRDPKDAPPHDPSEDKRDASERPAPPHDDGRAD